MSDPRYPVLYQVNTRVPAVSVRAAVSMRSFGGAAWHNR